jgi:antitoxin (DNA-binding transcriptional repressor) of toxin-antitoxin stability system
MTTVNVHQATTHLSRLLEQVAAGEEVAIAEAVALAAEAGRPVARIVLRKSRAGPLSRRTG